MSSSSESQYLSLIQQILTQGSWEQTRNGRTQSIFGNMMRFSLKDKQIPILTTKKMAWKTCLKELLWFIQGQTNVKLLQAQNVHIWDANASSEFRQSVNLDHYAEGLIGPCYGYQWRHFGAPYDICTGQPQSQIGGDNDSGIDQLQYIIDHLKDPNKRTSRRLIMTAWNPAQLDEMVLPPCHLLCQFNVHNDTKLSCALYQRSADVFLGMPFNIASYSFLTHLLAHHCGLEAYEFVYFAGNCHLYEPHIKEAKLLLDRKPLEFPTLRFEKKYENINDYQVEDFVVENYKSHDAIKVEMVR